jgi:hypothetical protein
LKFSCEFEMDEGYEAAAEATQEDCLLVRLGAGGVDDLLAHRTDRWPRARLRGGW